MKHFFEVLSLHKTPIFLSITGVIVLGCISFALCSAFFGNVQDTQTDESSVVEGSKNGSKSDSKSNSKSKETKEETKVDNKYQSESSPNSSNIPAQVLSDQPQSDYDYDAEMKRIEDEYNANMKKIEEDYEESQRKSEEELKRIEDEYNARMKQIEDESKTRESEEKRQQALEEARRMEEQAQREAANLCPNTHSSSYAQYQQAVSSANSVYNKTVEQISLQCAGSGGAFGGCTESRSEAAARTRDQAILSAKNLYKSQMLAVGCNPSDYVDW